MILLKANEELKTVFHKLINTLGRKLNWKEIFIINNNSLLLIGKDNVLLFDFGNKRFGSSSFEVPLKEDGIDLIIRNELLENILNMTLYVFGKWGKIKGLSVEKDYAQLNLLFDSFLKEIHVEPVLTEDNLRLYKNGIQITYEELVQEALDKQRKQGDEKQPEDKTTVSKTGEELHKYNIGLWHKMVWTSETFSFQKDDENEQDNARAVRNFVPVAYHCPNCDENLSMVIYPEGKELLIETDEKGVYLSRAFTCGNCHRFYTPKPHMLLIEGSVYFIDFEDDAEAYEDYLELMGEQGERTSNCNFNEYEAEYRKKHSEEPEQLDAICSDMSSLSDKEVYELMDKMDSGFYAKNNTNKYYKKVKRELKGRDYHPEVISNEAGNKGNDMDNRLENQQEILQDNQIERREIRNQKNQEERKQGDRQESKLADKKDNPQDNRKARLKVKRRDHGKEKRKISRTLTINGHKLGNQQVKLKKAVPDSSEVGDSSVSHISVVYEENLSDISTNNTDREEKQITGDTKQQKRTNSDIKNHKNPGSTNQRNQPFKHQDSVTSDQKEKELHTIVESYKDKKYKELYRVWEEIKNGEYEETQKQSLLKSIMDLLVRRGKQELASIVSHIPSNINKKQYELYKDIIENYKELDISSYLAELDQRRDASEKQEIAAYIKRANAKDRKALMKLYQKLQSEDFTENNKRVFLEKINDKIAVLDEATIKKICPEPADLSYEEGLRAYERISSEELLPEMKTNMLKVIDQRLTKIKMNECEQLVNKLSKDVRRFITESSRIHFYDVRKALRNSQDEEEDLIINKALNTYASGRGRYEFPIIICDSSMKGNGARGFVLTPDHIFFNSALENGVIDIVDIDSIMTHNKIITKGIYAYSQRKGKSKLSNSLKLREWKEFSVVLMDFITYLKEKPESRNISYIAKEKHIVKCCYRCGHVYRGSDICPKCGAKYNE